MVGYYVVTYDLPFEVQRRLSYMPEPVSYILPFNVTSIFSAWLLGDAVSLPPKSSLGGLPPLSRADLACYLGLLVAPASLSGLFLRRADREIRFVAFLFVAFLVLSLGPVLLANRQPIRVFGWPVPLPFLVWQYLPGLGAIAQAGRYLVVSYMALAVGMGCLVGIIRSRPETGRANLLVFAIVVAVCVDYGFRTWTTPLPPAPRLSSQTGAVLDPRLKKGHPMYYQTQHRKPLVGAYLSRTPRRPLERYRQTPGMRCLFFGDKGADCGAASIAEGLRRLDVSEIMLDPADWRNDLLRQLGYQQLFADPHTTVWTVAARTATAAAPRH